MLCFTCTFSTCCLQYASVLQAGNIFRAINWLHFLYPPTKGNVCGSKCDNTHIHNTQYRATAHFMHVRQLLSASCTIIAWQCIFTTVLVSHHKNKWLCYKNVNKYEVRSAIVSDFTAWNGNSYHQCPAWPLKIRPEGCHETSVAN